MPVVAYTLTNHSREQTYNGVTKDIERRLREHASGRTITIDHWDFERDRISVKVRRKFRGYREASRYSHSLDHVCCRGKKARRCDLCTGGI